MKIIIFIISLLTMSMGQAYELNFFEKLQIGDILVLKENTSLTLNSDNKNYIYPAGTKIKVAEIAGDHEAIVVFGIAQYGDDCMGAVEVWNKKVFSLNYASPLEASDFHCN